MPYTKEHKTRSKERILKSATELFCRYGFDKVSINQIMKLARMTHGAFYAHFESKEALYDATIGEIFRRCRPARLAKGPLSVKHLTTLVTDYLNLRELERKNAPGPEAILFNEIASDNPQIKRAYEKAYLNLRKLLETRITALGRLRRLPFTPDAETVAEKSRAILASLVGAVAIARSLPQEEEQRQVLTAAQKHIFAMLGVDEPRSDDWHGQTG
ncbi:MAG: TetR/AcrR family transcriptional regulator [Chromatiales bacterium]|nr:TetR/AcrR family transcriptional regulator [Chromatiales bacterium]MDX9767814.1 TetR/AcrR family transcriptional regulator [Ectothiorhodospiraceae bacterium]